MDILLARDHADLDGLLGELFAALNAGNVELSYARLDLFWARLAMHIRAEHLHLFPMLLNALSVKSQDKNSPSLTEAEAIIARLRHDHDFFMRQLAQAVNQLRESSGDDSDPAARAAQAKNIRQAITQVSQRLVEHNQLEEENIYRWATEILTEPEQAGLREAVRREITNLPPRFTSPA